MTLEAAEQLLRDQGCTLTPQRRAILRFLEGNPAHPTAAQIFDAVTAEDPVSSRATVYNTLTLLEQVGAVRTVRSRAGELRYDPNTAPHHHLQCEQCGHLEDVPAEHVRIELRGQSARGEVRFSGRCEACVLHT